MERERCQAAAAARQPLSGTAACRGLPFTGAFQSTFPAYHSPTNFGNIGDAFQLSDDGSFLRAAADSAPCPPRRLSELLDVDYDCKITSVLKADGTAASDDELKADAKQLVTHFACDVFNNHCAKYAHNCTET